MNKMSKRLMIASLLVGMSFANPVYASVLHSIKTEEIVTKGAEHIHEQLLMDKGWRNVNVLKIDLSDTNILVAPMESDTGLQKQTVLQMVQNSGAVAGVNADYFDMASNNSPSLGMLIEDGKLSHGYNSNYSTLGINKNMATFMIDQSNTPSMEYYGVAIRISANGTFIGGAGTKNVVPNSVTRPLVIDRTYYQTTNNIVTQHKTLYTLVVEEDIVTYQSKAGEKVNIPSNGYVIMVPESQANEYYTKLKVGTKVVTDEILYLNSGITTAVSNMKLGIGGSGLIMKNGVAYTGPVHVVTPNSNVARTVVATVKDSNEILLITVDKGSGYIGINQKELIEVLKRYNVKDAMYLDGGGSTTFVSRKEGSFSPILQNNPSDGSQRKVINGIGVFTTSQTGNIANLLMTPSAERTFVGESISFTFKGTDKNFNPVVVDSSCITYSVANGDGYFSGNKFTPTTSGKMLIIANYYGIEAKVEVNVSAEPVGLRIEPNILQLGVGASKAVQVYGIDKEGYQIPLDSGKITWNSNHSAIKVANSTVSVGDLVVGEISANYNGISGKAGVIGGNTTVAVESLETNTGAWAGDAAIKGMVFSCEEPVYHGNKSLKMTYTFKASNSKQIAYTVFNKPIEIASDASSINMWLYGRKQNHMAKLEVVDSTGNKYNLTLTDQIDFEGWKYLSASIPEDMVLPAKVTKFYVSANSVSKEVTTAVYLDHFSITRGFRGGTDISVRSDYLFDPLYKDSLQAPIGNQYIVNVVGPTKAESMTLDSTAISQISKRLSNHASLVLKASSKNSQLSLNCNQYTYTNSYQAGIQNTTKFIMLGTGSGGIRTTDVKAWTYLKDSIANSASAKNIIIVTSMNPLTQFTDKLEGQAFHDYLVEVKKKTGKNIFVVYAGGTQPEVCIEDGIRYIRTNGINVATNHYEDGSFVKFKIDGNAVYYTLEKFK